MKKISIADLVIFLILFSLFEKSFAADPILEKVAEEMNKQLPTVTSSGESELYKAKAENDTLIQYLRFYGIKKSEVNISKEAERDLYQHLIAGYCALPYEFYQKGDLKWKWIYSDSEYSYLFSFKVSKRDC